VTRYLLDTNVVSELRKRKPHGAILAWLETLNSIQILISVVTVGELQAGVELTRKQDVAKAREIEQWIVFIEETFTLVSMDAMCFRESARLMAGKADALREDAMIAATARLHGLTVATRDEKDFRHFNVDIFNPFRFH
jgi:predicted nucleic acid-binding protein